MRIVNNYLNMCLQICVFCELGKELGAKIKIPGIFKYSNVYVVYSFILTVEAVNRLRLINYTFNHCMYSIFNQLITDSMIAAQDGSEV